MAAPQSPNDPNGAVTPGEARREGMKKSKWVAAGVAVGAAAFLTGVIAGVNGADGSSADGQQVSSAGPGGFQQAPRSDDGSSRSYDDDDRYESDDDFGSARPFDPRSGSSSSGGSSSIPQSGGSSSGSSTQQSPSFGPQSRSGGS
jgi:hypothetical protein